MGLDLLDIKFRIEKVFQIELDDRQLVEVIRDKDIVASDLYELILCRLHLCDVGRHDIPLNFRLWEEIQSLLHDTTGVALEEIRPGTPLESLFPRNRRRQLWNDFREKSSYRLRELEYPRSVRAVGLILAVAMVVFEQVQLFKLPGAKWFWMLLGVLGVWMFVETYTKLLAIAAPWRAAFPPGLNTVKDLCRTVLAANYSEICQISLQATDAHAALVWQQLKDILAETLDVDEAEITFRTRLVADLGMS